MDAGANAFYSGLKTLDFGGLADKHIWRLSSRQKVDYFFAHNPGAAIFIGDHFCPGDDPADEPAGAIGKDPRFQRYALAGVFRTRAPGWGDYAQVCYIRKDLLRKLPGGLPAYSLNTSNSQRE